jgi:hypothetical protein
MPIADCRFDGLKIGRLEIDGLKIDGLSNASSIDSIDNRHFNRQSTFGNPSIANRQSPIANG